MVKITGSDYHPPALTEEEIRGIIDQGHRDEAIEKTERDLVHQALAFDDTVIRTVMTPRTKMFGLPANMLIIDALPLINSSPHSRFPIFGKTNDDIVGFVHVRDVLKQMENPDKMITLKEISREPVFASQEKMVSALLKEMKGRKTHVAIVIDEHGGVEGLVTLEDLIEEIVGEIQDETDAEEKTSYKIIDKHTIIASGDMEIPQINEIFKTDIEEGDDYATLSGLLHHKLKDIPHEGDKVEIKNLRFVVEKEVKNVPKEVRIERITNPSSSESS